uniref:Uncharacterized protein n=1 Tax=Rhizophora mucronata TaxID=61149 RepID=A0A2P2Q1V8_RHIMU
MCSCPQNLWTTKAVATGEVAIRGDYPLPHNYFAISWKKNTS